VSRRRRTAIVLLFLVVVPLCLLAIGVAWFWWQLNPPGGSGAKVEVQIAHGCGVPCIGNELSDRGVIGPAWVFNVYSRLNGDTNFKAGTYELKKNMGVSSAVKSLKAGPHIAYVKLTIPPGFWLQQITARVGKLPGLEVDPFVEATRNNAVRSAFEPQGINNLEGLLWPDTYNISADEDEIAVLSTLVTTFDKRALALGLGNASVQGHNAYDVLKVASLVEAEAKIDADRPKIASVIYNRLARGMPLQIDATLIYARGDPRNRTLSNADKQIDSPYNTYAHTGLPPTPIAAVSAASLTAALHPADTPYLYYVVIDKKGDTAFATTLEEQNANIAIAKQNGAF
jgi:peptidoglycan lytic transglycosylase G